MKKVLFAACLAIAVLIGGCGKDDGKKNEKMMAAQADSMVRAAQSEIPILQYDDDTLFDDDDIADFAFFDDEQTLEEGKVVKAEKVSSPYDDWDDEELLQLSWDDANDDKAEFKTVNFDLNRNTVRPDQRTKVAKNVETAKTITEEGKEIVVAGHCCSIGSASYNMSLSEQRAKAIQKEMVKSGIPQNKIKILGCGSECPIVLSDAADRAEKIKQLAPNRRAEITIS